MNIVTDGSTFLKKQHKPPMKRCPEIIQWTLSISILPGTSKFFEIEKITVKTIFLLIKQEVNKGLLGMY